MQDHPRETNPALDDKAEAFDLAFKLGLDRFPVWTLGDVGRVAVFFFLAALFFGVLAVLIASGLPAFRAVPSSRIATDPRLIVPAQFAAYAATFWFVYRMIARHYGVPFAEGIRWRWPGLYWPAYIGLGVILAFVVTALQNMLPMPSEVPFEKYLRNPSGIWVLAIFATALAPFAEEIFFRGLLYPSLSKRYSVGAGIVGTSVFFALLHGTQLAWHWAPLLILFLVGLSLTLVRAWARSVAASALMHVSYNATLFVFMYVATAGFRHLEKVSH